MACFKCQCGIAFRLMLVLLAGFALNTLAECQGTTKGKGHMVPGESVSPRLSGKILQLLFDGVADLYFRTDAETDYYFIKDANGRLFTISVPGKPGKEANNSWRQGAVSVLKAFMRDIPGLHGRIESCALTRHEMVSLMHDYHASFTGSDDRIVYELPPPALIPHIGIFAGYNVDMLKFSGTNDLNPFKLDPAFFPAAGISFSSLLPRLSKNLSVSLDLSAGKRYLYGFYGTGLINYFQELHVHNYLLLSEFEVVYKTGYRRVRPYVSGGICARTIISDDSRLESVEQGINYIYSYLEDWRQKEKKSLGLKASLGLAYPTPGKITFTTSLDYSEYFISSTFRSYRSVGLTLGANF